ncbi:hypothetical protein BASA84_000278 [Batrachochytrium salamandrivorans]|nr:hypothetical protein BASA84_000278 [Batrachochytrium salamandrivorans]
MVALVQTLIAVMLIPVAFAAPASSIMDSTPTSKAPAAAATTGLAVNLTVSTDSRCGKKAGSKCGEGTVARSMTSVELRKTTVALDVSQHLVYVIPPRLLKT